MPSSSGGGSSQLGNLFTTNIDQDESSIVSADEMLYDLPAESFLVPNGQENDWVLDHNHSAVLMQRKSSMKLIFGSAAHINSNLGRHYSRRHSVSLNPKRKATSFIGFPMTPKSGFVEGSFRHYKAAGNAGGNLVRSLSEPRGLNLVVMTVEDVTAEPGSPKVSCTGRVEKEKGRAKKTGLWSSLKSVLRIGLRSKVGSG